MARLSTRARRSHERDLAAAFAGVLARQTARVAESIRHRAVTAAAEDDEDWWDQEQAVSETEHALRGPIQDAAVASGAAVAAAYGGSYAASPDLDRQVAERTRLAAERTAATTKAALGDLVDEYDDPDDAADAIADYGSGGGRAGLVGVMEAAAAFGLGGLAALGYLASKDDDGRVSAKTWILSADHDEADECDDNDGTTIPADDDWPDGAPGELHFGCLIGSTQVRFPSDVDAVTHREYVGHVVEIELRSGQQLTGTPNHPVATSRGWVALAELHVGDEVIRSLGSEWTEILDDPHVGNVPPSFEQVAETLPVLLGAVPTSPEDFHGDGAGSEVHVVRADRFLRDRLDAPLGEQAPKVNLGWRDVPVGEVPFAGGGRLAPLLERVDPAAGRLVGSGGTAAPFLGSGLALRDEKRLAQRAPFDTEGRQVHADGPAADAEGFCEGLLALAGEVTTSQIVRILRYPFRGHVFNASTRDGWYVANGIVTHNCLCEEDYALVDAGDLTASASSTAEAPEVSTLAPMPATATPPAPPAAAPEPITAGAIASHSTPTTDEAWDGQAAERALSNDDGAAVYREAYAWVNPAGQPDAKNSYWGPHHMVSEDGEVGAANLEGCRKAIKALNGSRGASGVPAGDRQSVYNHLTHHLKAGGVSAEEIPALKAASAVLSNQRTRLAQVTRELGRRGVTLPVTVAAEGHTVVDLEALRRMVGPTS